MEAKADNAKGAAAMTDHLSQLDAAAELFRAMMHPGGIEAEHKAYCKAALALDHAAIAAAWRAKDAEIESLRGITVAHDALRIEFNRNAKYLRLERRENARLMQLLARVEDDLKRCDYDPMCSFRTVLRNLTAALTPAPAEGGST